MLNKTYLALLVLKCLLAAYFISHGLNLSKRLDTTLTLAESNMLMFYGTTLGITRYTLEVYAHL